MALDGWVKLHKKSIKSLAFQSANLWQVFSYCLMRANFEPTDVFFNGGIVKLQPGQFITGRFEGAKDCNMPPSTFRNQLEKLKLMGNLDIKSDNRKSIITVVKYSTYQITELNEDSRKDNKRTTRGQQEDTEKNIRIKEYKNKTDDSPESSASKYKFIDSIIEIYKEEYQSSRGTEYLQTTRGKDRDAIGSLLKVYKAKETNKGKDSEQTKQDFRQFFRSALNIRSDTWIRNNISPSVINSQLNRITNIIKKENGTLEQLTDLQQTINDF